MAHLPEEAGKAIDALLPVEFASSRTVLHRSPLAGCRVLGSCHCQALKISSRSISSEGRRSRRLTLVESEIPLAPPSSSTGNVSSSIESAIGFFCSQQAQKPISLETFDELKVSISSAEPRPSTISTCVLSRPSNPILLFLCHCSHIATHTSEISTATAIPSGVSAVSLFLSAMFAIQIPNPNFYAAPKLSNLEQYTVPNKNR
ncbi:hypothetical protein PMIN06_011939 [Paraphaeosphaeria minitans]